MNQLNAILGAPHCSYSSDSYGFPVDPTRKSRRHGATGPCARPNPTRVAVRWTSRSRIAPRKTPRKTMGKWWFHGILWEIPSGLMSTVCELENGPVISLGVVPWRWCSIGFCMFTYQRVIMRLYRYLYLVGGISSPLKNMKVSWDDYS